MTIKALVLKVEGEIEEIEFEAGEFAKVFTRETGARGFDCIDLLADLDMWADDEGLFNGAPANLLATSLRRAVWATRADIDQGAADRYPPLNGNVLLTGGADGEGEITSLPSEHRVGIPIALGPIVELLQRQQSTQ